MVTRMNDSRYTGTLLAIIFVTLGFMSQSCATETVAPMKNISVDEYDKNTKSSVLVAPEFDRVYAGDNGQWHVTGMNPQPSSVPGKTFAEDPPQEHNSGGSFTVIIGCYGSQSTCFQIETGANGQRRYLDIARPGSHSGGGSGGGVHYHVERAPYP